MNSKENEKWPQSSIDDIITQCESISLSSSETDNITLDSGIFLDNKIECKNPVNKFDGRSLYNMLNSDNGPPPPPYNSTHNIISSNLQAVEVSSSFQTSDASRGIPVYHDDVCSNNISSPVNRSIDDTAYLNDTSVSHANIALPRNHQLLTQRLVDDSNLPALYDKLIKHSSSNDKTDKSILPQLPGRPKMNYTPSKTDDNFVNCSSVDSHYNVSRYIYDSKLYRKNLPFDNIEDSKILGICNKCQNAVSDSESACIALGSLYHSVCFLCCYCNRSLRGKVFYKDHDNVYCENDYMVFGFHKSAKICTMCGHIITESILEALGKDFHPRCFKCCICEKCLDGIPFTVDQNNNIYCIPDYHLTFAPRCAICCQSIIPCHDSDDVVRVVVNDRDFHVECYRCQNCFRALTNDPNCFVWTTDRHAAKIKLLCRKCYGDKFLELSRL